MWPFQARTVVTDDDLAAIRNQLAQARARRTAITERRCDRATAERRCVEELTALAARGATLDVGRFALASYDARFYDTAILRFVDRGLFASSPHRAFEALEVSQRPDEFRERALAALAELYADGDEGLTDAARAAALAECDAELLRLELAEERLIRDLERAGSPTARRTDADPAVILAPDDELDGARRPTTIDVDRLHGLEDAVAAVRAALFDAQARLHDADAAAQRAGERAAAAREHARRGGPPYMDANAIAAVEAFATDRERTRARHAANVAAAQTDWEHLIALATRCRRFATERGVDLPPTIEPGAPPRR